MRWAVGLFPFSKLRDFFDQISLKSSVHSDRTAPRSMAAAKRISHCNFRSWSDPSTLQIIPRRRVGLVRV